MNQLLLGLLFVAVVSPVASATEVMLPPKMKELAQVWIGETCDQQIAYRLQLDVDGTGTLIILDWLPASYRIASTRISDFEIAFQVVPLDTASERILVSGTAYGLLQLDVQNASGSWKHQVTLTPYESFMRRFQRMNSTARKIRRVR